MAKIIYFISPIDESKNKEIISKGTLRFALKELGIENDTLCVTINGMTPDELDLDLVLDDNDIVEVRRLVHGGGRAGNKSALATVVQIVALVALTVASGGGASPAILAAIAVGGAVAAGALNKWAADLLAAENATTESEVSVSANSYSLKTATNQARPLKPIPVPIGSSRYAPDIMSSPFIRRYGSNFTTGNASFLSSFFQPALIYENGPDAPNNSWATMPANYITAGFPKYEIKIAPYGFIQKTSALTTVENSYIIDTVKSYFLTTNPVWVNRDYVSVSPTITRSYPIVIYHSDAADPFKGRFNLFFILARLEQFAATSSDPNRWNFLAAFFNGTTPSFSGPFAIFYNGSASASTILTRATSINTTQNFYNMTLANNSSLYVLIGQALLSLNGGSYSSTPKINGPSPTQFFIYDYPLINTKEGIPYSTQIFNYGIGDLTLSDNNVGTIDINVSSADTIGYATIDKSNVSDLFRWKIPNSMTLNWGLVDYPLQVYSQDPKKLINPSFNIGFVSGYDMNAYNWIYFSGANNLDQFKFAVYGRIYTTSSSGFSSNSTKLQVQYKLSNESFWKDYQSPVITITNSNTNPIYIPYALISPIEVDSLSNNYLEVRIRKINLDSTDNENNKVSDLTVTDISFYQTNGYINFANLNYKVAPMNLVGVYSTALISDSSTTNKYSALVEAKCWVYDFDAETWSWSHTRNPAFWFLYFARGGFYNYESMADYSTPYSPTYGWQNYPNHPNNTSQIFGGGYIDEEIDMDKILEWAFFCEDQNLNIDGVLKDEESVSDTLEKIANVGRGSVTYYAGNLSVVYEDPEQVPTCMFGMGNIIADSFTVDYAVGDPVRKVVGTFVNRETWETETVEAFVPFSDPEVVKELQITLLYITDKDQAQREVNILAARQFFQKRVYTFKVDWEGFLARRGDLAYLSHDSTQYGFSGRVAQFVVNSGVVIGIKSTAIIDSEVSHVSVRLPNGQLDSYSCEFSDGIIKFTEEYPIEKAPFYVNMIDENTDSIFNKSIAEDFVFIADVKPTTGKKVRISSIEVDQDNIFTISAVDEDPSMWAYEFDEIESGDSFNDSELVLSIVNLRSLDLGQGKIRLLWDMQGGDFAQVINLNTGLPLEANGQYSFSEGDVVFELSSGIQYELEVRPMAIGTPYKSVSQRVKVWPM